MVKILAIGNSFSEDATYYLHQVLASAGVESLVVNLYVGGCSLERHWRNIEDHRREYELQVNGRRVGRMLSVQDALREYQWDHIVIHQASHDSGWENTYEPFLELMLAFLKDNASGARIWLNETWAYEEDSDHDRFIRYRRDQQYMYSRLKECYEKKAAEYGLPLIPSGDLIQALRGLDFFNPKKGGISICRDGFHMNYLYGRYAVAVLWARMICGVTQYSGRYVPSTEYMPEVAADEGILREIWELTGRMAAR